MRFGARDLKEGKERAKALVRSKEMCYTPLRRDVRVVECAALEKR